MNLLRPQLSFPKECWIEYATGLENMLKNYIDQNAPPLKRPNSKNIHSGIGFFFADKTGVERCGQEIDDMCAQIDAVIDGYGFGIEQQGTYHGFTRFFGKAYLDQIRYAIDHGDAAARSASD
jgi:hypothetical protein